MYITNENESKYKKYSRVAKYLFLLIDSFVFESISQLESICQQEGGGVMYEKIQKLLDKENKTAYQVSIDTGISQTAFSNWKTGRTKPELKSLKKLSNYFNVPIEYFLEE